MSEVARLESGHTPSRGRDDYWDGGIPWIGIKDATSHNGEIISSTFQHVSQLGVDNSSTRLLPEGTVCLSRTASVGYVVQMGVQMCTSQDFVNWVCKEDLRPDYLRYALVAESDSVRRWATGSTHQTLYYPEAKAMHILMPSRGVQDDVTQVLGAFDDKIDSNRRVVATALKLGESIVCASHLVPKPLGEVAAVTMGTSPRGELLNEEGVGFPFFQGVRDFGAIYPTKRVFTEYPVRKASDGSTLFAVRAPVGKTNLAVGETAIGRGLAAIASSSQPATLFFAMKAFEFVWDEFQGGGTIFASVNAADVRSTLLPMPAGSEATQAEQRLSPLLKRIVSAEIENELLASTRNELLQPLMSGKITVKDAEKRIEREV